jgi:amino acid transporter
MRSLSQQGSMAPSPAAQVHDALLSSERYVPQVMPAVFGSLDMTSLFLLNVLWVTNVTPLAAGGAVSFTYWILCGMFFFVPCSLVMAQLASLYPSVGGIYNWTLHVRGPRWGFFVGLCAWLPGILSMINACAAIVSLLQAINDSWFPFPWQQGCVIGVLLLLTWTFSMQRTRVVQHVLNVAVGAMGVATLLMVAAVGVWLMRGHPSMTNFTDAAGWRLTLGPQGNLALLGSATLALLGSDMPLALPGETKHRKTLPRHLIWGTILTLGGYVIFTLGVLVIQGKGAAQQTVNPMVLLVGTVDHVFGQTMGSIMAFCLLLYFLMIPVALNLCFSRLLVVAALHQQISVNFACLTRQRVPATALRTQVFIALFFTVIIYIAVPLFNLKQSADLSSVAYNVLGAGLLLVWAISFLFPFLLLAIVALRQGSAFRRTCLLPFPLLLISMVTGPVLCTITFLTTLTNSFIPTLLPNETWTWVVGAVACVSLLICGICSMLSNSEARWEIMQEQVAITKPSVALTAQGQQQPRKG